MEILNTPLLLLASLVSTSAETVFWTNYSDGRIYIADENIENHRSHLSNAKCKFAVASKGSHIYWADEDANTIKRADLDGANTVVLLNYSQIDSVSVGDIELTENFIYWTQTSGVSHSIYRSNLDGSNAFMTGAWTVSPSIRIGASGSNIYIPAYKSIWIYNTDTGLNREVIGSLPDSPWKIRYHDGFLYWAYSSGGKLYRSRLDGGYVDSLLETANSIDDISFTSIRIHLCSQYSLYSCRFDGTDYRESKLKDGFVGSITASDEVLIPRISIDFNAGNYKIVFSGALYRSIDLIEWTKESQETGSPFIIPPTEKNVFYRAHATFPK